MSKIEKLIAEYERTPTAAIRAELKKLCVDVDHIDRRMESAV